MLWKSHAKLLSWRKISYQQMRKFFYSISVIYDIVLQGFMFHMDWLLMFFVPTVVVVLNYQLATAVFALVTRWRVDWKWLPVRCCPKPETDSSDPTITANSSINWLISAELTGWIIETAVYIFRRLIRSVFPFPCEILWKEKKDEVVHSTASVSLYVYVYFNFFLFWFSLDVNNLLICLTTE